MNKSVPLRLFILSTMLIPATSSKAELMIGDKAPKLQTGEWIQGEPVRMFDSNHVYILEFWATWCGPCIASIPHLNELWEQFKDNGVIVIGQDVWDSDEAVTPFVKKMGGKMTYRVALDDKTHDPDGLMSSIWWKRKINNHGIPHAFVINKDGVIAWIGHPMGLQKQVLDDILSGHYDLAQAAAGYKRDLEENNKMQDLQRKVFAAVDNKKWDEAESALNETLAAFPRLENSFAWMRLRILLGQKKHDEAYQFAESFGASRPKDFDRLNALAWTLLNEERVEPRGLDVAAKLAARANDSSGGTNAKILDTLARAQFMTGKTNEAVATQKSAVAAAPEEEKNHYQKVLADYQRGKLP
jgi:thiol-disulfide isomerase/thioredoxin